MLITAETWDFPVTVPHAYLHFPWSRSSSYCEQGIQLHKYCHSQWADAKSFIWGFYGSLPTQTSATSGYKDLFPLMRVQYNVTISCLAGVFAVCWCEMICSRFAWYPADCVNAYICKLGVFLSTIFNLNASFRLVDWLETIKTTEWSR